MSFFNPCHGCTEYATCEHNGRCHEMSRARPMSEQQGRCERSSLATCSLPAFDAEALEQWLTDRIAALQEERETAHKCNVYSHAERCKNYAAAYEAVKLEMRRRMGRK